MPVKVNDTPEGKRYIKCIEVFESIQGEGLYIGVPTVFIRLAGCNLHCQWCDTKYAWNEGREYLVDTIAQRAKLLARRSNITHYDITGGEPLLQRQQVKELVDLLNGHITIETNCTFLPFLSRKPIYWSVSPKLQSAQTGKEIKTDILSAFAVQPHVQFKFVIDNDKDLEEVREYARMLGQIILQPQSSYKIDYYEYLAKLKWLTTRAREMKLNARVLPQLHKLLGWR